ncbi:metal-dependent hydrolase [Teichococcus aestuarii]|uniref:metal-dependent hydrolase n=1 Tax=Teichococcus aestuarii TaxID=568898 RepID=UPI0036210807
MMAGSHIALGAAAWFAAAPRLGLPALDPALLGLAVFGALLPDIDHPKSWVGKKLWPVSLLCARLLGHRGITHSALAVLGCTVLLLSQDVPMAITAPLVVGYLSHLGADLLTPAGLRRHGRCGAPMRCRSAAPARPSSRWWWRWCSPGPGAAPRKR